MRRLDRRFAPGVLNLREVWAMIGTPTVFWQVGNVRVHEGGPQVASDEAACL